MDASGPGGMSSAGNVGTPVRPGSEGLDRWEALRETEALTGCMTLLETSWNGPQAGINPIPGAAIRVRSLESNLKLCAAIPGERGAITTFRISAVLPSV